MRAVADDSRVVMDKNSISARAEARVPPVKVPPGADPSPYNRDRELRLAVARREVVGQKPR